jgi:predicted transcriptional regulator
MPRVLRLTEGPVRITVYDMKNVGVVTVRLDRDLKRQLDRICRESDRTRSDVVRDALRRQIALMQFEQLRRQVVPLAEARGYLTDEDVAADVS